MSRRELAGGALASTALAAGLATALVIGAMGCSRKYRVGDHVLVHWRGAEYPAVITKLEGSARFGIHYDGFSSDWDEVVPATRIVERLPQSLGPFGAPRASAVGAPGAPGSGSATPSGPRPSELYRIGDHVRVEWHRSYYGATILSAPEADRYRVHYDGYGDEWDETVPASRIQRGK